MGPFDVFLKMMDAGTIYHTGHIDMVFPLQCDSFHTLKNWDEWMLSPHSLHL